MSNLIIICSLIWPRDLIYFLKLVFNRVCIIILILFGLPYFVIGQQHLAKHTHIQTFSRACRQLLGYYAYCLLALFASLVIRNIV